MVEVAELVHKDQSVHKVLKVTREIRVHQVRREIKVTPALQEQKAKKAIKASAANKVPLVLQDKLFTAKVMPVETAAEIQMDLQVLNL